MTTSSPTRKLKPFPILLLAGVAALGGALAWRYHRAPPPDSPPAAQPAQPAPAAAAVALDLERPDALIVTRSLSQLPRDLLTVPLLKSLLTEDFVFYYEQTEGRLGLKGTLRRIAYEHDLDFGDELLAYVFDAPAHLALWKAKDGKLGHFIVSVESAPLMKALQAAARVALDDRQLKLRTELPLPEGGKLAVFELNYAFQRTLLFAEHHGRLLVFSDAELLLERTEAAGAQVSRLLAQARPEALFEQRFALPAPEAAGPKHRVAVAASYLSFGYQHFFPALDAVRFDFAPGSWSTALRLTAPLPAEEGLWRAAPTNPALCAALPWQREGIAAVIDALAPQAGATPAGAVLAQGLKSPAAVCWYRDSALHTPLILARAEPSLPAQAIGQLFALAVGGKEAGYPVEPAPAAEPATATAAPAGQAQPPAEGATEGAGAVEAPAPVIEHYPPFAVSERECPGGRIWQREVSSKYGPYEADRSEQAERMRSPRYFKVSLAYCHGLLAFSPDDRLVENVVAVLDKRYPALADSLPQGFAAGALIHPGQLAALLEGELKGALPEGQEALFRSALARHLSPQLKKFGEFPPQLLGWPAGSGGEGGWVAVPWQALAGKR